jgi:hypothetical protein
MNEADTRWRGLYRMGAAVTFFMALVIPIQIFVFLAWPPPSSASEYFALFQRNPLLGMLDLDLLLVVDNILAIALYLALYVALRRAGESAMALATILGLMSIALYCASREATFTMASLSDQYAAATSDAQRAMLLATGHTMLAIYNGAAFQISYVFGAAALLIVSIVMLRSNLFGRAAAYLGIVANVVAFGLYVPAIGVYISVFSVVFLWIWDILVALSLVRLSRQGMPD